MNNECSICLEELDYNKAILKCGHVYHYDCIVSWMNQINNYNKFCPCCRDTDNEIVNIINVNSESKNLTYINQRKINKPSVNENNQNFHRENYNQNTQIDNNSINRNYNQFRLTNYHSNQTDRNRLNQNQNKRCTIL